MRHSGFISVLCASTAHHVLAGEGGFYNLINGTPFDWKLLSQEKHKMQWSCPESMPSGSSSQTYFEWSHGSSRAKCSYTIEGAPTSQSFQVTAAQHPRRIDVSYSGGLSSLNNPQNSTQSLGFVHDGSVVFVLAGDGMSQPYVSSNPPVAWMQAMLPTIGSRTLREITMVASHDAGMSRLTRYYGGVAHNTVTQKVAIGKQLEHGARFFDVRPFWHRSKFFSGHFTQVKLSGLHFGVGGTGQMIREIVRDINDFTKEHLGELITLNLSHEMDRDHWNTRLTYEQWQKLYRALSKIDDLWAGSSDGLPNDLTTVPISNFIQPGGKSAVLLVVPDYALLPSNEPEKKGVGQAMAAHSGSDEDVPDAMGYFDEDDDDDDPNDPDTIPHGVTFESPSTPSPSAQVAVMSLRRRRSSPEQAAPPPLPAKIFSSTYHFSRLSFTGSYSNTESETALTRDQLDKLRASASDRSGGGNNDDGAPPRFQSSWTLTQHLAHVLDVGNADTSIVGDAHRAHHALYEHLWPACERRGDGSGRGRFPNLIELDAIDDSGPAALAMAITAWFGGE